MMFPPSGPQVRQRLQAIALEMIADDIPSPTRRHFAFIIAGEVYALMAKLIAEEETVYREKRRVYGKDAAARKPKT